MSDNTFRIEFDAVGGGAGSRDPNAPSSNQGAAFDPVAAAHQQLERDLQRMQSQAVYNRLRYGQMEGPQTLEAAPEQFDPGKQAQAMLQRERQAVEVKKQFNLLKFGQDEDPAMMLAAQQRNASGMLNAATQVAGKAGVAGAGELGGVAGAVIGGLGPLAIVAAAVMAEIFAIQKIVAKADEFAAVAVQYNAAAAQAQAMAEVRGIQGDVRRSDELGPELGRYLTAQSKLDEQMKDLWEAALTQALPVLTAILEVAQLGLTALNAMQKADADLGIIRSFVEGLNGVGAVKMVLKILEWFNDKEDDDQDSPLDQLFKIKPPMIDNRPWERGQPNRLHAPAPPAFDV